MRRSGCSRWWPSWPRWSISTATSSSACAPSSATIFVGAAAAGLCYVINDAALDRLVGRFRHVFPLRVAGDRGNDQGARSSCYLIRAQRIALPGRCGDLRIRRRHRVRGGREPLLPAHAAGLASWPVWVVRGFGTAIMHGGATAIFAIVSVALTEKQPGHHGVPARPRGGGRAALRLQPFPVPAGPVDARHPDRAAAAGLVRVPAQRALGR